MLLLLLLLLLLFLLLLFSWYEPEVQVLEPIWHVCGGI